MQFGLPNIPTATFGSVADIDRVLWSAALDMQAPLPPALASGAASCGAGAEGPLDLLITFSVGGFCFGDDNVRSVRGGQREVS